MRRLVLVTGTVLAFAACMTARRVASREWIDPGTRVEVDFPVPQDLFGETDSATYAIRGVRFVSGRVETAMIDTLVVRVRELVTEPPQPDLRRPTRVFVARHALAHVSVRRGSREDVVIASALLAGVAAAWLLFQMMEGIDDWLHGA